MADLNIKQLISYSSKGILSKELVKTERGNVALFCLAKGTEISEHTSTKSGMVYVVEGKGVFELEGKKIEMLPGVLIFMEKNAAHSLKAKEDTSFILTLGL
ncbi:MAG TPA: cupin domain-containing protein [Candidatus Nanoarchaeia archaeon]|nr:cupin domain-containing protein [Candidatus Nanoarchaeia archaeon]